MTAEALVITIPINANTVIVVGSATTWPTACSFCERPKRVKSGMLSERVDQKPIIAVTLGTNTGQNAPNVGNLPSELMISPSPEQPGWPSQVAFAFMTAQTTSSAVMTSTYGAEKFSTFRTSSMPL